MTENTVRSLLLYSCDRRLYRCDAVDFDVEMAGPGRNIHEDSGRRVFGKIPRIDRVHGRELLDRSAIHVTLEDVLKRRSRRHQAELHLLKHKLGLALDRRADHLAGNGIE